MGHAAPDGTKVPAIACNHKAISYGWMLMAQKDLDKEINALMRNAEIPDAKEDRKYGRGNRGSELPEGLRLKQGRLARIRQARQEMDAETAAATAWQRRQDGQKARAQTSEGPDKDAPPAEQVDLRKRAEAAATKAKAARDNAIEAAEHAGLELPDLEPLATST